MKYRKRFLLLALCVILVGVVFNVVRGTKLDIKFTGGAMLKYSYSLDDTVSDSDVSASDYMKLDKTAIAGMVKEVTGQDSTITIAQSASADGGVKNTITVSMSGKKTMDEDTGDQLAEKMTAEYPRVNFAMIESNSVDATTGSEFFGKCLMAVFLAAVFMIIYVALRFRKIGGMSAGITAIIAIIHDCLIVYFAFVALGFSINDNFIAVLLTIIGYSINSTIIIYDRIRENREVMGKKATYAELANRSLNETLGRTINTNLTLIVAVLTVVIVAFIYDITSIITFAVPMLAGVIAGTYSSMFISNALWVTWREYRDNRLTQKKLSSFAKKK
ncbi:MAG: protein translocase subunit SecF [Clostridia bacterium]|nr:protein translocase subunit SecF [Clostridia bacterium]MBQ1554507.1 protein translocase subunit SecF [Clostridia bacterium]MBQ4397310.1 protein translocase subunit SecF [Clostridia bacterium]